MNARAGQATYEITTYLDSLGLPQCFPVLISFDLRTGISLEQIAEQDLGLRDRHDETHGRFGDNICRTIEAEDDVVTFRRDWRVQWPSKGS